MSDKSYLQALQAFNPTLVQFKPTITGLVGGRWYGFQSYLSPIQTWCGGVLGPDGLIYFQSYLSPIQTKVLYAESRE